MLRTCRWCQKLKPHYPSFEWCCKDCHTTKEPKEAKERRRIKSLDRKKVRAERRKLNPKVKIWRREHHLKQRKLTIAKFNWMLNKQNNCCAVCGSKDPQNKNGWIVDHDHKRNWTRA